MLFICLEVDCHIALTYLICLLGLIVAFRQHISDASSYISVVVRLSQNIQIISLLCLLDQRTSWFNLRLSNIVPDMAYALLKLLKVDNISCTSYSFPSFHTYMVYALLKLLKVGNILYLSTY